MPFRHRENLKLGSRCRTIEVIMSEEVDNSEITGELTNASAARGPTPTLVVRRPDDGSRPEIPVMTLRSHSRGG